VGVNGREHHKQTVHNNPKADISPELALQNPLCDNPFELVYEVL
jgi:hypothetical protein